LFLFGVLHLAAQTSAIQGAVTDQQGAIIPTAVISVTNQKTAASRKTIATDTGACSLVQLPPGTYMLEVQSPGFSTFSQQIRLHVNTPVNLDVKMEVGQVTETINVTAEAAAINTQNATIGNPFTERRFVSYLSRHEGFSTSITRLSHSIDIASSSETNGGTGSLIQDSFNPSASRASSDFDIRHNITADTVVELPFGRSKQWLSNAPRLSMPCGIGPVCRLTSPTEASIRQTT
jgi:Carboxypeptidase regulatory-like domain